MENKVHLQFGFTSSWLGRLAAKPLSAASKSESRKWAWFNDSQSDSTALKSALKSGPNSDANRRALLLPVNFIITYKPIFGYRENHLLHLKSMIKKFNSSSKIFIIGDLNQDLISGRGDRHCSIMNSYNFSNSV